MRAGSSPQDAAPGFCEYAFALAGSGKAIQVKERVGRVAASTLGFLALGWLQGFWALRAYGENLPADMADRSISAEMMPLLLFWAVFIGLLVWPMSWRRGWRVGLSSGFALVGWFWVDLCVYDSRVASWSTYTLAELALEVAELCHRPLLLAAAFYLGGWGLLAWRKTRDQKLV